MNLPGPIPRNIFHATEGVGNKTNPWSLGRDHRKCSEGLSFQEVAVLPVR